MCSQREASFLAPPKLEQAYHHRAACHRQAESPPTSQGNSPGGAALSHFEVTIHRSGAQEGDLGCSSKDHTVTVVGALVPKPVASANGDLPTTPDFQAPPPRHK